MQCYGTTQAGTRRFRCVECKLTTVRKRSDRQRYHVRTRLIRWLLQKETLSSLATRLLVSRQVLSKQFQKVFYEPWRTTIKVPQTIRVLILDATWIHKRELLVLVALLDTSTLVWSFAPSETTLAWCNLLRHLPPPQVVVVDGHTGLLKAVHELWPFCAIQRCHFHIAKRMRNLIPRRARLEAAQKIRKLVLTLKTVRTHKEAESWYRTYETWETTWFHFLNEKSWSTEGEQKHWWYTHKKLRALRSHLTGALLHLFTYLDYSNVPNTTNHVEGGVNTKIKAAIRDHRGLRIHQKKTLVSILLANENKLKKPTRKFT